MATEIAQTGEGHDRIPRDTAGGGEQGWSRPGKVTADGHKHASVAVFRRWCMAWHFVSSDTFGGQVVQADTVWRAAAVLLAMLLMHTKWRLVDDAEAMVKLHLAKCESVVVAMEAAMERYRVGMKDGYSVAGQVVSRYDCP